jgi:hypothetical protein
MAELETSSCSKTLTMMAIALITFATQSPRRSTAENYIHYPRRGASPCWRAASEQPQFCSCRLVDSAYEFVWKKRGLNVLVPSLMAYVFLKTYGGELGET